jgi:hypothetical protein
MIIGKIELGLNIPMAGETELRVLFLQEILGDLGSMNLMTVVTSNVTELMDSPPKLEKHFLFFMALQTDIRTILCIFTSKREYKPCTFCLHMLCARAVTRFAFFSPMRVFPKKIINVRMTLFAGLRPHIPFLLCLPFLLTECRETDEGYQNAECNTHNRQVLAPIHGRSPSLYIRVRCLSILLISLPYHPTLLAMGKRG